MESGIIRSRITKIIEQVGRYPFLFVGSGLSLRYLHTPNWVGLLQRLCSETLLDEFAYARFLNKARSELGLSSTQPSPAFLLPKVASLMEPEIDKAILEGSGPLGEFRARHADSLSTGALSPMKVYICNLLNSYEADFNEELKELQATTDKLSGIITTNYDLLCEKLFPSYTAYVGERGMLFNDPTYSQEIYKIHGSVTDPNSIVLTEEDYQAFANGRDYLVAKLLTIFMEYPIVFLGYSIQDENVQRILSSVVRCAGPAMLSKVKERLVFVQYGDPGDSPLGTALVTLDGQAIEMTSVTTRDFSPIYQGISDVKKLYEPRLIKELRGSIFRLARQVNPTSEILTMGIDSLLERFGPNDKVVIGLGTSEQAWGLPIDGTDLYEDIVFDNHFLDPELVVRYWLDRLMSHGSVPFNKYVAAYDGELFGRVLEERNHVEKCGLRTFRNRSLLHGLKGQRERLAGKLSVQGLIGEFGEDKAFSHLYVLEKNEIDADELRAYLARLMVSAKGNHDAMVKLLRSKPEIRRAVRIYDYIRYFRQHVE